jgi:hypothetical protein
VDLYSYVECCIHAVYVDRVSGGSPYLLLVQLASRVCSVLPYGDLVRLRELILWIDGRM